MMFKHAMILLIAGCALAKVSAEADCGQTDLHLFEVYDILNNTCQNTTLKKQIEEYDTEMHKMGFAIRSSFIKANKDLYGNYSAARNQFNEICVDPGKDRSDSELYNAYDAVCAHRDALDEILVAMETYKNKRATECGQNDLDSDELTAFLKNNCKNATLKNQIEEYNTEMNKMSYGSRLKFVEANGDLYGKYDAARNQFNELCVDPGKDRSDSEWTNAYNAVCAHRDALDEISKATKTYMNKRVTECGGTDLDTDELSTFLTNTCQNAALKKQMKEYIAERNIMTYGGRFNFIEANGDLYEKYVATRDQFNKICVDPGKDRSDSELYNAYDALCAHRYALDEISKATKTYKNKRATECGRNDLDEYELSVFLKNTCENATLKEQMKEYIAAINIMSFSSRFNFVEANGDLYDKYDAAQKQFNELCEDAEEDRSVWELYNAYNTLCALRDVLEKILKATKTYITEHTTTVTRTTTKSWTIQQRLLELLQSLKSKFGSNTN